MNIFKRIKNYFCAGSEYRPTLEALIEYLPAGDLEALNFWVNKFIPYKSDTDPLGLDNFNGADLTIKERAGDCESIAAIYVEVIRAWKYWESVHVVMLWEKSGHDVCFFKTPSGSTGWIDGKIFWGGIPDLKKYYGTERKILSLFYVNDIGEKLIDLDK